MNSFSQPNFNFPTILVNLYFQKLLSCQAEFNKQKSVLAKTYIRPVKMDCMFMISAGVLRNSTT